MPDISKAASPRENAEGMAIVGMSCRFPGSMGCEAYYQSLLGGADLFAPPPRERWSWCADDAVVVRRMGVLDDVFGFDNALFRLSPREAETMDPHQRLLLEEVWLAIEDAGYHPEIFARRSTGVFAAMYNQDFQFYTRAGDWDEISRMYLAMGGAHSIVPNRVSYVFDLHGPSEVVDTACSSALVALHRAVEAIRNGECEQAVVGGASLLLEPSRLVMLQDLGLLAIDGDCMPFDRDSGGQVLGEGVAAIIVKPLARARKDRDFVYAVIGGTGVNHQGARSGGLTRPSAAAQADLMRRTYARHRIDPETIRYVEAHGNGGSGDVSELLAFQDVLPAGTPVGSVKGNIGFLEAAGGLSQVIKVAMAMRHGVLPGTRSHRHLLEDEALSDEACRILQADTLLEALRGEGKQPFTVAVHAYGLGGCNAHVVLREPCSIARAGMTEAALPLLFSGEDVTQTAELVERFLLWLAEDPAVSLSDMAFTLATGRPARRHRLAIMASTPAEAATRCRAWLASDRAERAEGHPLDDIVRDWLAGGAPDWNLHLSGSRIGIPLNAWRRRHYPLPPLKGGASGEVPA
ncbi:MAG: beta-ketoacyl synthase N-terminal-like domain-containing protein [Martelella sp.]|uniref:beta-ketoacyl synthase N-terminal-like domain-containing protein n=1 Tax=Martelella sp. TaxID=1969699 RepID=UPI00324229B7